MAQLPIKALLWRRVNQATVNSLAGQSRGQYHITLPARDEYAAFFTGLPQRDPTGLGGFSIDVPIHAFDGPSPVPPQLLKVRYMGNQSERRDWNIPAQRPATAYPLWSIGRGLPSTYAETANEGHYLFLIHDREGGYHARWITPDARNRLPAALHQRIRTNEVGVVTELFSTADASAEARVSDAAHSIARRLRKRLNVLLYGPPGTGKTHLMQEVTRAFTEPGYVLDTAQEHDPISLPSSNLMVGWVTFHQSYSYEEFLVGLRPDPASTQLISLVPRPGLLLELAAFARQPGKSALLLVDEINRGNVSRIFGEFITLLEADKRLDDDGNVSPTTVPIHLPYLERGADLPIRIGEEDLSIPNPFTMPQRLYLLASMNSVDKSTAPLDVALRRRFDIVHLPPDLDQVRVCMHLHEPFDPSTDAYARVNLTEPAGIQRLALVLLHTLNRRISFLLGPDFRLGQWYLAPLCGSPGTSEEMRDRLVEVWKYRIFPQLEEMFHGRTEKLATLLRLDRDEVPPAPLSLERPNDEMEEYGALPYLERREVTPDALVAYLVYLVGSTAPTGGDA